MDRSVGELARWAREHIRWYGQSAFRIRSETGTVVFIDPSRVRASEGPAHLILITHPHGDHYVPYTVDALRTAETRIVMPEDRAIPPQESMRPGETGRFGTVGVTAVAAYNVSRKFHPQARSWLGYVVEIDGIRIYHAGDTDLIPEMNGLRPDIALLPIGGFFTMDWQAAAQAARALPATLAVPMHFNALIGGRKAGERFCRKVGPGSLMLPKA